MKKMIIIGGGAAGMMCAIKASESSEYEKITLFEKNEKLGKKLYITGKGRCNFTNASDEEKFLENVVRNRKFLYSSIYNFNQSAVIDFFESEGLRTKVERGGRAFPESDRSSDVIKMLERCIRRAGTEILIGQRVQEITAENLQDPDGTYIKKVTGVISGGSFFPADTVVIATGGLSYPSTGSTGDGFKFAKALGLKVTEMYPSLTGLRVSNEYIDIVRDLEGLSLRNVELCIYIDGSGSSKRKILYQERGEMLFTHNGISGPLALSASSYIGEYLSKGKGSFSDISIAIDLKPALSFDTLDNRLIREFGDNSAKQLKNIMHSLVPKRMVPVIISAAENILGYNISEKKAGNISAIERKAVTASLKGFDLTPSSFEGFDQAIITKGGIDVKEIDPATMESKKVKGLKVIGEALDCDALTGGYNLQIAWATGALAAE